MYKVSVILPIYNNEATLKFAIESLLNQTSFDFELLLMDDGSTDSSTQICMEYAKREPLLIKFIRHEQRVGFAETRNRGLREAKGLYIYFADARNIFASRMLESNIKLVEEQSAELVVFGFRELDINTQEISDHIPKMPFLLSEDRFRNHYRNFHEFNPYELCNKLFNIGFLREKGIKFKKYPLKEKAYFNLDVYRELNKVVFNRQVFCQKPGFTEYGIGKYQKELLDSNLDLVDSLKKMFAYWGVTEEYHDMITREYFQLIEEEVLNLLSSSLNRTNKELEKEIARVLRDERLTEIYSENTPDPTKNLYEKALWNSFQKGTTRVIIQLIQRRNHANRLTRNIKGKLKQWFN